MTQQITAARRASLFLFSIPVLCLLWAYWTTLAQAAQRWGADPSYSHGYLVPIFAAVLLWLRRDLVPSSPLQPSWWWGAGVLAFGIGLRLFGTYFHFVWLDPISLIPCLAGLCLLVGGRAAWRWAWPAILFLAFMIPLPYRMSIALSGPLQQFATTVCTFLLQTLGVPALAEGNVIWLSEVPMGIVEACSGLRMLVVFFALSTAVALVLQRPLWEKIVIVASAVPIALAANVLRITATGVLHETVGSEIANAVFHDFAGWLMMPVALGMLWVELKLLANLFTEPATPSPRRRVSPGTNRRPAGRIPKVSGTSSGRRRAAVQSS